MDYLYSHPQSKYKYLPFTYHTTLSLLVKIINVSILILRLTWSNRGISIWKGGYPLDGNGFAMSTTVNNLSRSETLITCSTTNTC